MIVAIEITVLVIILLSIYLNYYWSTFSKIVQDSIHFTLGFIVINIILLGLIWFIFSDLMLEIILGKIIFLVLCSLIFITWIRNNDNSY